MDTNTFIRLAAPFAGIAAAIGIPADLYHLTIDSRAEVAHTTLFKVHGLLLVVAMGLVLVTLLGLAFRRGRELSAVGVAGVTAGLTGTVLVLANISTEAFAMQLAPEPLSEPDGYWLTIIIASFGLFAIGWLLTAVELARAGTCGWGAASVLIVGSVIGFSPLPGSYILMLVGIALTAFSASRRSETPGNGRRELSTAAASVR